MSFSSLRALILLLALSPLLVADSFHYVPGIGIYNNVGDALTDTPNLTDREDFYGGYAVVHPNGVTDQTMPPDKCEFDFCQRSTNGFNNRDQILITDSGQAGSSRGSLIELYSSGQWKTVAQLSFWESRGVALNNNGAVLYVDLNYDNNSDTTEKSYVYQNGKTQAIVDPNGKLTTYAEDISDSGEIVGSYSNAPNTAYGFIEKNGRYTTVNGPGMTGSTILWMVNSKGEYVATTSSGWLLFNGFSYVSLNYPGFGTNSITGLNNSGEVVGDYLDAQNNVHAFLFAHGVFTEIESGHTNASVAGILDNGDVYGAVEDTRNGSYWYSSYLGIPIASTPEPGTAGVILAGILLLIAANRQRRARRP